MVDDDDLLQDLLGCETAVWRALQRGDAAADRAALHPAFLGVYPSGFAGRDAHCAQLADGPTVARFTLSQARVMALAPDCALLAYRAAYHRPGDEVEQAMYVSSIWKRAEGAWINVFSQDTEALPEGAVNPLP
ncbi:nuclear transport factor 2 family protein [Phaeobacter sp. QD34_3]|uniref:nuclear transport factor 2 family protein n=1 Tax=unclassified Phaeobacter TaxID=2621772 RepID=UPI00237F4BFE|nr:MULTISPECIES: nuclear transport factor 2 family protein [unclassified Phaeobacter]MDE4131566.1 nuclear transport factor 2 family protein [Phaeobacter sp. QD34_3]MDE4135345.1 nuclear transport factor 2 family protein [Phaeobacter sp. QD34_24]MDE4174665.1 nuclear transport factor 2 family protein [Phaeobacter sp. PT47_59]